MEQESEFLDAVRHGDASVVAQLLRRRPELARFAGEHAKTGLHWAAVTDQPEVARLLLEAGAEIEARTSWGASPLDWAATMGSARVGELLVSHGASGLTLVVAAGLGKLDEVRAAVASGADLSTHRRRGAPDLPDDHWPADSAHLLGDVVSDAMYAAARNGRADVVEYLLDRGAAVDANGSSGPRPSTGQASTATGARSTSSSLAVRDSTYETRVSIVSLRNGPEEIAAALHPGGSIA